MRQDLQAAKILVRKRFLTPLEHDNGEKLAPEKLLSRPEEVVSSFDKKETIDVDPLKRQRSRVQAQLALNPGSAKRGMFSEELQEDLSASAPVAVGDFCDGTPRDTSRDFGAGQGVLLEGHLDQPWEFSKFGEGRPLFSGEGNEFPFVLEYVLQGKALPSPCSSFFEVTFLTALPASVIELANQPGTNSFHFELKTLIRVFFKNEGLVGRIRGVKLNSTSALKKLFQGGLAVDEGNDGLPVFSMICFPNHDKITIENSVISHRVALYLKDKMSAARPFQHRRGNVEHLELQDGFDGPSCSDSSKEREGDRPGQRRGGGGCGVVIHVRRVANDLGASSRIEGLFQEPMASEADQVVLHGPQ
mgnify:CR=1 FL=1